MTNSFIFGDTGVIPPALEIVVGAFSEASIDSDWNTSNNKADDKESYINVLESKVEAAAELADKTDVNENEGGSFDFETYVLDHLVRFPLTQSTVRKLVICY